MYILLILAGRLRDQYPEIHYLSTLVSEGDYCIDIGANLGYYTVVLSRIAGREGRVVAVEPVKEFNKILCSNCRIFGKRNVEVLPFAVGKKRAVVEMGTPEVEGIFRHGLTRVVDENEDALFETYQVAMRTPEDLFGELPQLDFIKCDVEGYERHFFEDLLGIIERFQPIIQIEINSESNRRYVYGLLSSQDYVPHKLSQNALKPLSLRDCLTYSGGDFYFVPSP